METEPTKEPTWISPRKAEELQKKYNSNHFEAYMQMVDAGKMPRAIAIQALKEEEQYLIFRDGEEDGTRD